MLRIIGVVSHVIVVFVLFYSLKNINIYFVFNFKELFLFDLLIITDDSGTTD